MAVTEVYVDSSIGADSGAGTIGDPYGRLSYAFTQSSSTTNGKRYNVKGTTLGSPETSFGTPPAGSSSSKPVYIQGYTTVAGDGGTLFVDGGGSTIVTDTNKDGVHCINCHFKNYGSSWAFSLDNNCSFINCTFDGGGTGFGVDADSYLYVYNCYFTNIRNKVFKTAGTGKFCYNTVHVTTIDADTYLFQEGMAFIGNRIRIDQSVDVAFLANAYRASVIAYNSIKGVRGSRRDKGIYLQASAVVRSNYLEGFEEALDLNGPSLVSGNVFFNNDSNLLEGSKACNLCDPVVGANSTTLSATGLPNIDNLDFTPTVELRDVLAANDWNRDAAALTTGMEQQFGAVLNVHQQTEGYRRKLRTF